MSLFADEFAEKSVKKYINGKWLNCYLSDYYVYLDYFDEGGYGIVHKVMDRFSGQHLILKRSSKKDFVAAKLPPDVFGSPQIITDEEAEEDCHMSQEAVFAIKVFEKLNGIKLCDYYDDDDQYIMVMEDGGRSLESITSSPKKKIMDLVRYNSYQTNFFYKMYLQSIAKILVKIYHKIKSIHDLDIHHNDLKPENVLISEDLDGEQVHIIDFGVAKPVQEKYASFKGTLEYVPYEYLVNGEYKPWDHTLWCFGVMLYSLCLMSPPFLKEEDITDYNLNYEKINKLPSSFATLIYDCLHKDPTKRPRNLLERLQELRTY
jgi:serine/threonine protein kinase